MEPGLAVKLLAYPVPYSRAARVNESASQRNVGSCILPSLVFYGL